MATERWNDQAIDGLKDRLDGHDEEFLRAEAREERRIRDVRSYVDRRLAEQPIPPKVPWKTIIAFAGTVIVPVVLAILGWVVAQGAA